MLAIGLVTWAAYSAGGARGIGAADRDHVFSTADAPDVQRRLPALDVPLGAPPTVSVMAARGSLAIALGRRGAIRDLAAVAAALTVVIFGCWLTAANVALFPVALTMMAMSVSATFWTRGTSWSNDGLSAALMLVAAWALWRWLAARSRLVGLIGIVAGALAIVEDPLWIATLPGVLALRWSGLPSHQRLRDAAVVAAVAVLAFAASLFLTGASPWVGGGGRPGLLFATSREFTPLGVFLATIGTAVLLRAPSSRVATGVTLVTLLAWHFLAPRATIAASTAFAVCGWAAIAVALAWVYGSMRARSAQLLLAAIAIVLVAEPGLARVRFWSLGKDGPSERRAQFASDVRIAELPPGTALVAESRRADAAVLLTSRLSGHPAVIVPQQVELVRAALDTGRPIAAFAHGRDHLAQHGFLFERAWAGNVPVAMIAGHTPCVDLADSVWTDVSLLVAGGSFVVHGGQPDAAPGGVVLRQTGAEVAAIEPRSIPFEVADTPADAEGVADLKAAGARSGVTRVTSLRLPMTGRVSPVTVTLASAPAAAVATAEDPIAARLCAGPQRVDLTLGRDDTATASLPMNDGAPFGSGWHPLEADPDFFRWTAALDASVRVSVAPPGAIQVTITATPASRPAAAPTLALTVNGCRLATRPMQPGQGDYQWEVEEACWRPGFNQLWIATSPLITPASLFATHDTRLLGARIGAIRLARLPRAAQNAK